MPNLMNYYKNEGDCKDGPCPNAKSEIRLNGKEDLVFLDKRVTEIGLPPMSESSNNDTSFHTVKDICVDEGVQSFEKILVEYDKVDNGCSATRNLSETNGNGALMVELSEKDISQDLKPSSVKEGQVTLGKLLEGNVEDKEPSSSCKFETYLNDIKGRSGKSDLRSFLISEYAFQLCCHGNAVGEGNKLDTTERSADVIPQKFMQKPSDALQELNAVSPQMSSSSPNHSSDENQHMRQNFDQVLNGDEDLKILAESSPEKAKESTQIEETFSSKGGSYKDNLSSFPATSRNSKLDLENRPLEDVRLHDGASTSDLDTYIVGDGSKVTNLRIIGGTEEPMNDGTISARYSFCHVTTGDSSFPGLLCTSGLTTSLDHAPYSGSISLRSDSSTTSGHSFAFPILQSEWNSSPVRMSTADRRHSSRKWMETILCCKF